MTEELETIPDADDQESEEESPSSNGMLSKATVSKIVERERQKAYEKGRQERSMEQEQQQQPPMQQQQQSSLGGMKQLSSEDISRMISEQAPQVLQQHINQAITQQTVDSFINKMQAAEAKYPGLEAKLNDVDFDTLAPIIQMANGLENTGDVIAELLNNPMKMGNLLSLMQQQPKLGQKAMQDLSNSIKTNEQAVAEEAKSQDPMSQLKPSSSTGRSDHDMSVTELREMFSRR